MSGRRSLDFLDAFLEGRGREFRARIAARLFQLLRMSVTVGRPNVSSAYSAGFSDFSSGAVADDDLMSLLEVGQDFSHQRIGFRVHRRGIQRIVAVGDAQEAGGLLEGLVARGAAPRAAPRATGTRPSRRGSRRCSARRCAEAGDPRQQRRRGGVDDRRRRRSRNPRPPRRASAPAGAGRRRAGTGRRRSISDRS